MATMEAVDTFDAIDQELNPNGGGDVDLISMYRLMEGMNLHERDIARAIYLYASPVFLLVGTISNVIASMVILRLARKVITTSYYLAILLVTDTLLLYIRCGNYWIVHVASYNVEIEAKLSSNSLCKLYPFLSGFILHLSIWLFVCMAVEMAIVSLKPERLLRFCKTERTKAVVLLLIVLLVCLNAHCFWTIALIREKPDQPYICSVRQGHVNDDFQRVVWPVVDILFGNIFPYLVVFSCTVILITRRLRKHQGSTAEMDEAREDNIWKSYALDGCAARQFPVTVIALCILYLITMVTKLITDTLVFFLAPDRGLVQTSLSLEAKKILAEAVGNMLYFSFISCKLFVLLGTSEKFRYELKNMITCCGTSIQTQAESEPNRITESNPHRSINNQPNTKCVYYRRPLKSVTNGPIPRETADFEDQVPLKSSPSHFVDSTPRRHAKPYSITSV